ncbi:hypothetical protein D3C86_1649830 [compost metagenome]
MIVLSRRDCSVVTGQGRDHFAGQGNVGHAEITRDDVVVAQRSRRPGLVVRQPADRLNTQGKRIASARTGEHLAIAADTRHAAR